MQLLMNRSKFLTLAALSCTLWIVWFGNNVDIPGPAYSDTDIVSNVQQNNSVWSSIQSDLKLDHEVQKPAVQAQIRELLADQDKLNKILQAAAPYIYYIHNQTQARGLPAELALIPVIESEFNPNDHSKKGATGLWQLMPETAHELGIKIKSNYDGRRNVVASTNAALAYFNDLGNMFHGNWDLAIAAYNCGQFKIEHAEKRAGSKVFWQLALPKETKCYVPKLLAVAAIIKNPEKYGVTLPPIKNVPFFTQLKLKKPVNLSTVAKSSGISMVTLDALNPEYKHGVVTVQNASLLVPANKAALVKEQLANDVET